MTPLDMVYWIAAGCFAIGAPAAMFAVFAVLGWAMWNAHQNTLARQLQAATAHMEVERKLLLQRDVSEKASQKHVARMKMLTAGREVAQALVLDSSPAPQQSALALQLANTPKLTPKIVHDIYAGGDFDPYGKCECDMCVKPKLDVATMYAPGPTGNYDVMLKDGKLGWTGNPIRDVHNEYERLRKENPGMGTHSALMAAMDKYMPPVDSSRSLTDGQRQQLEADSSRVDSSRALDSSRVQAPAHAQGCNCDYCWY